MSKRRLVTTTLTLEVRLQVPYNKSPSQVVNWLVELIHNELHGPSSVVPSNQHAVRILKKELLYA